MTAGSSYYADAGPGEVRIYADAGTDAAGEPVVRELATLRTPDHGTADDALRAYGWHRVSAWMRTDSVPAGHRLALVEPDEATLTRDQQIGDDRRGSAS
jgi:hypothetical protein